MADDRLHAIEITFLQEQFDLHTLDLAELEDFIYEDLPNLYRGQLDPDLRMDAVIKEKSGEYSAEYSSAYDFAMDKLNAIMFSFNQEGR